MHRVRVPTFLLLLLALALFAYGIAIIAGWMPNPVEYSTTEGSEEEPRT